MCGQAKALLPGKRLAQSTPRRVLWARLLPCPARTRPRDTKNSGVRPGFHLSTRGASSAPFCRKTEELQLESLPASSGALPPVADPQIAPNVASPLRLPCTLIPSWRRRAFVPRAGHQVTGRDGVFLSSVDTDPSEPHTHQASTVPLFIFTGKSKGPRSLDRYSRESVGQRRLVQSAEAD